MQESKKQVQELRKQHNADLIRRMRNGEPLNAIDSKTSWYPPRPIIKKDAREMARLYPGVGDGKVAPAAVKVRGRKDGNVRTFGAKDRKGPFGPDVG